MSELPKFLTPRQIQVIDDNLKTFGHDLRCLFLAEFNGQDWDKKQGHVLLYVRSWRDPLDYPVDLGRFDDAYSLSGIVHEYIRDDRAPQPDYRPDMEFQVHKLRAMLDD